MNMNMYKILLIITLLFSYTICYSQDTLIINKYQARCILKDKVRLKYLESNTKQDSLLIQELEYKVKNYVTSENTYKLLIDSKDKTIDRLIFKNKIIIIGSSIVTGYLLYQAIK